MHLDSPVVGSGSPSSREARTDMQIGMALTGTSSAVLADSLPGDLLRDVALVFGSAVLVGALAQVVFDRSFTPVPVTGRALGVLLAGASLGWKRGATSMALYGVAGLVGVHWFAVHTRSYAGANFVYLVGFIFSAAVCGHLVEHRVDHSEFRALPAMLIEEAALCVIGIGWLGFYLRVSIAKLIQLGLTLLLLGDLVMAATAAALLPIGWRTVGDSDV